MALAEIEEVLSDLKDGKVVVLIDDENRENEGDFVVAAEHISIDLINFFTRIGGGYLCVAMTGDDCDRLELSAQVKENTSVRGTPFTISVDGHPRHNISTGISAADRVNCSSIRVLLQKILCVQGTSILFEHEMAGFLQERGKPRVLLICANLLDCNQLQPS